MLNPCSIDFETYSPAGYRFDGSRWVSPLSCSSKKSGLKLVGAARYSEHADTEILSLAYDTRLWLPGMTPPVDLFDHIRAGRLVSAYNSLFEYFIWHNVAVKKLGWPPLPIEQMIDTAALAYLEGAQGSLLDVGKALHLDDSKK